MTNQQKDDRILDIEDFVPADFTLLSLYFVNHPDFAGLIGSRENNELSFVTLSLWGKDLYSPISIKIEPFPFESLERKDP